MLKRIDAFLNKITMYRLVLYFLLLLVGAGTLFSFFSILPYSVWAIPISVSFITIVCLLFNYLFSYIFEAPANVESVYITALILSLIITPIQGGNYYEFFMSAFWISALSIASKYILAIKKKHVFNPAAVAVLISAFALGKSATWWVGNIPLFPIVLIGGILITRKIRRTDLVVSFIGVTLITIFSMTLAKTGDIGGTLASIFERTFLYSPLFFFAFIMLTEPLTTPPRRVLRIIYGALVGLLFAPTFHIGGVYFTPELALIVGNIFVYIVSPKIKLMLTLKKKVEVAQDIYDFWFESKDKLRFLPGQYLEWTLSPKSILTHIHKIDSRGNRRYFTVSSSPTESGVSIGVKFYNPKSSFKSELMTLEPGDSIVASQLSGDFTMPHDVKKKLVFIAGGIGVTPFRSMIKYLIDKNEHRDIVQFYSARTPSDIAYRDIFNEAELKLDIKTFYAISEKESFSREAVPWISHTGFINEELLRMKVPDFAERMFYLSGPRGMIDAFKDTLQKMGVKRNHIKTDYFPGFV